MSNIIFDAALILIFILGFFVGIKVGFIKMIAKPVKIVAALALAFSFSSTLGPLVIAPIIEAPVANKLETFLSERFADITAETVSELPTVIKLSASLFGIDISEVVSGAGADKALESIITSVTSPMINFLSIVLAFIAIYFVSMILMSILVFIIDKIVNNGFVGFLNSVLGCVFTLALSFVIAWAVVAVSDYLFHVPAMENVEWVKEFTGGPVYRLFKNLNPIDLLLSF